MIKTTPIDRGYTERKTMIDITQVAIDAILDKYSFTNKDQSIRIFIKGFS